MNRQTNAAADCESGQELDVARNLIRTAEKHGADCADAVVSKVSSTELRVRNAELENSNRSETGGVGLRVIVGRRQASVSTSRIDGADTDALVERAIAMARNAPEDPYLELVAPEALAKEPFPELETVDAATLSVDDLFDRALEVEAAAISVKNVSASGGASAGTMNEYFALVTSNGFEGVRFRTGFSVSSMAYASNGKEMQMDYDFSRAAFAEDLRDAATIGRTAGERAAARLGGVDIKTSTMPVVFDRRVSNSLIEAFANAISGKSVAMGTSFLKDHMSKAVFSPGVHIVDDPLRTRSIGSRGFDDEGVATRPISFVNNGKLTEWMLDSSSAHQLGLTSNGHAERSLLGVPSPSSFNLYLDAGEVSVDALLSDIREGLFVTRLDGQGVNGVTGDYSRGASGFRIVNGRLAEPIGQATIASNLKDMYLAMTVADDLVFEFDTDAPTVRVDGMMVVGR